MKFSEVAYFGCQIIKMHLQPKRRIPLSMYIVLTNRCNNHCVYCRTHNLPQEDLWNTEILKSVMLEMKKSGVRRVQFTGGEPMLRDDIGEIIAYAKSLGFFVGISTNGYKVSERIDELRDVDVVFLSYDGPDKVHSRLRGKNNLEDVKSALVALKSKGIRVWTTTVLTRWNVNFIKDIVNFSRKHNILANFNRLEFFSDYPCYLHPHIKEVEELVLRGDERKRAFQELINLKLSGAPIGSSLKYLKSVLEWPYDERITDSRPSKSYKCWAGRAYGHLNSDGKLYSCGWGSGSVLGVDVLKEGFKSAWSKLVPLNNCQSCSHACGVENNLIFSLNFSVILNAFRQLH